MRWLTLLLCAGALLAQDAAERLVFSKSFPGSKPEYYEIRLAPAGAIEYREAPDEDDPIKLRLRDEEARAVFLLAEKLDHFKKPIESGLPVAKMGEKTFRWEKGDTAQEQKFNYSVNADAQQLLEWVDRISESAQYLIELERTARYDRLGVNKSLLLIEAAWDKNRIVGHAQFMPMLKRIANNESYMNMARERAAKLLLAFADPSAHPALHPPGEKKAQ